ncbi:hypothetical protein [Ramlibacter sp.]|uniref:hypothetical protein n=1 Tax=Ramlibacter sp. TaxID=1917967 RepID=UPI002BA9AD4E|nr:hypothetical protein [Ramlibacter sp.]HWI82874.1 hypothetical protein [Ramlibacter sp.]
MSNASDKLAQTRLAIIAHLHSRERHHERRGSDHYDDAAAQEGAGGQERRWGRRGSSDGESRHRSAGGWLGHLRHVVRTWWRHHPASMGLELVTPVLSNYASRKPVQYLGIAAAVGAVVMLARPWRLISVTGLVVAIVKSSQLSSVVMSAMAGADYGKDGEPPV